MDLRNWEFYENGTALVGATVKVRDASLTHPNAGTVLDTTLTNSDGMWAFTGLTDTAKDVEIIWGNAGQYHRWLKGLTRHNVANISFEEQIEFKQVASLASAAGAGSSILAFKTDGEPIFRSGAAGTETKIATFTGADAGEVLKAGGWGKVLSADIEDGTIATADIAAGAVGNILLTYTGGMMHAGAAIAASTEFAFLANQTFTTNQANSVVGIFTRGGGQVQLNAVGMATSRAYIDSAGANTLYYLGGQRVMVASEFANPFTGFGGLFLNNLSAGAHTINIKLYAEAAGLVYQRNNGVESFSLQVVEWRR